MSKQTISRADPSDPLDALLCTAFEQVLSAPQCMELADRVLARIERQQRQRSLLLILFGLVALVICMMSAMPLVELLPPLLAEFSGMAAVSAESQLSLPVTLIAVVMAAAGGWLLLDEATT